jgi:omega-amidase
MQAEVRVALVPFAPAWLDPETNRRAMCDHVLAEGAQGADVVVFPELSTLGYISPTTPGAVFDHDVLTYEQFRKSYFELAEPIGAATTAAIQSAAAQAGTYVVFGMAEADAQLPGRLFNSAVLVAPDGTVWVQRKLHIPLNEKHFFTPGNSIETWDTEWGRVGVTVCYDSRFPELSRIQALQGAEILINVLNQPSGLSIGPTTENLPHRAYVRAQENGLFYAMCCRSGSQGTTRFVGPSVIARPSGELLARADADGAEVLRASLQADEIMEYRSSLTLFGDRRPELYGAICERWA